MAHHPLDDASRDRSDEAPGFTCLRVTAAGEARITVSGELDLATAPELDDALRTAQRSAAAVTLDMSRLRFIDVRGLRVVLAAAARARELGARFLVVRGPPAVTRVFELTATDVAVEFAMCGERDRRSSRARR